MHWEVYTAPFPLSSIFHVDILYGWRSDTPAWVCALDIAIDAVGLSCVDVLVAYSDRID